VTHRHVIDPESSTVRKALVDPSQHEALTTTMSTLSSVMSNLVRASMGSTVSSQITDEDLDRHVAELILREAKQKAERYGKDGIRAYLPPMWAISALMTDNLGLTTDSGI
jgi:hypothetical protein